MATSLFVDADATREVIRRCEGISHLIARTVCRAWQRAADELKQERQLKQERHKLEQERRKCELLEKHGGVPDNRIYINFFDVPRANCGWSGRTFAG